MTRDINTTYDIKKSNNVFDTDEASLLISAIRKEQIKIVQELIENGSKLNIYDKDNVTPLMAALELKDCMDMFNYLLLKGADINFRINYSPLMYAIWLNKEIEIIKSIIGNGAELFSRTNNESSILHIAAKNNNRVD